ncbi:MAG: MASE1 domain-containing protein [Rhodocyclales bacterium]|nr:MASE1 domain-containing protein [Rhodocyclales bacterium]
MAQQNNVTLIDTGQSRTMLSPLRPRWHDIALLIIGYVALDWASYIHPLHGLNITPWNPAPALGLIFLLRFGHWMTLPIAVAIVLAETWVRGLPVSFIGTVLLAALLTFGYWAIAEILRRLLVGATLLSDRHGLLTWAGVVGVGTLINSALFVAALSLTGLIPGADIGEAVLQYWVGDGVGVLVTMPLLWMLTDDQRRSQLRHTVFRIEFLAYLVFAAAALWIAFGLGANSDFQYFYALFLPIAWAASRRGLPGAIVVAAIIQFGIILAVQWLKISTVTVLEIQILAAVIALFGFFIGVVVDEKQRVSDELRQTLRLAAAGEMAGALAHELNQPLTALAAYGSACELLLDQGDTGTRLRDAVRNMVRESVRAAEVLRRLRDFFRTGTTKLEAISLADLISTSAASFARKAQQESITLTVGTIPSCELLCDRLQLEVVLRNLLSNAFEAAMSSPAGQRSVRLSVEVEGISRVCVSVEDSGSGLDETSAARIFAGFQSTKASGLGLGLVISRAIAEAHGGNLWAEVSDHGVFRLLLPVEGTVEHAA